MAQNNIENEFSKKLNEREIAPSPMAWDRLDAMLTVAEQGKAGKRYNWIYVAAGFLGFLFIGLMLFNQTEQMTDIGKTEVVVEEAPQKAPAGATQNAESVVPVYGKPESNELASQQKEIVKSVGNPGYKVSNPVQQSEKNIPNHAQNAIASNDNNVSTTNQSINHNQKTEQAKKSIYVDVDELLASVDKTPKKKEISVKVDSNTLLSEVDGELEMSFRERVIQTVSKQYKNVKVALSNRNVQN